MEKINKTIYIDVSIMKQVLFLTGIQRVVKEEILKLYDYDDIELCFLECNERKRGFNIIPQSDFMNHLCPGNYRNKNIRSTGFIRPDELEKGSLFFELDATWMCRMKRSYLYPILKDRGVELIVHVYDIICVTHPQFFDGPLIFRFMDYIGATMQYADKIICNAHATKDDLMWLGKALNIDCPEVCVVPLGSDFTEKSIDEEQIPTDIIEAVKGNKYILMVGTIEPRKNHRLLLDAYDAGLEDMGYNIIMAGTLGWKNDAFMKRLASHKDYGRRLFLFSKQPDHVIDYLYKNAKYVAFLSYKEGYGLPIIEALAKGVPVIASDTPVNKEIGSDKCVYFKQDDAEDMCHTISEIDDAAYEEMRRELKNYDYCSWEESARLMREALIMENRSVE